MSYKWEKQIDKIEEVIEATHDPLKEWSLDPKGYFLIRVKDKLIEVGYVTNDHVIKKSIHGTQATDIYNTIIRLNLISRFEHAAYLGKELYKAELALRYKKEYRQEFPLDFSKLES
tara:strand:+ start:338 stop:685 length:348 start_codon:yes stop_codon:yes gene_type:complete